MRSNLLKGLTAAKLIVLLSTQVWAQTPNAQNQQTRIKPNGETYILESSNPKASQVAPGSEQFPILEAYGTGAGEFKADVHRVVLERTFQTPNRIRVKMKVPLFKYKPVMSGHEYFVESTKEVTDPKTGSIVRVKEVQKKRLVWCGLEPCLMRTPFLLQACEGSSKSCSSAYDEIIIDFSKAQKLNPGAYEHFFISAYQRKIPGKAIDFIVLPITGRIQAPRYIVKRKNPLRGPDVYKVRLPNKKEIAAENRKNKVDEKDILDIEAAAELNKNTRYTTLPVNMGLPGQPVDPNGTLNGSNAGNNQTVEELCLDELGHKKSSRIIQEGLSETDILTREQILEQNRQAEQSVASSACSARRNHLVLEESLAGQKGAIDRAAYLKSNAPKTPVNSAASLEDDLEVEED